jgi:hypothetical protein
MSEDVHAFHLRLELEDAPAPTWRQLVVRGDTTLEELHRVLQVVMGWERFHLHTFRAGETTYAMPDPDAPWRDIVDERTARLDAALTRPGQTIIYTYDHAGGWTHVGHLEAISILYEGLEYPACIDGEGACPKDDIGGPVAWAAAYDEGVVGTFDVDRVNVALRALRNRTRRHRRARL